MKPRTVRLLLAILPVVLAVWLSHAAVERKRSANSELAQLLSMDVTELEGSTANLLSPSGTSNPRQGERLADWWNESGQAELVDLSAVAKAPAGWASGSRLHAAATRVAMLQRWVDEAPRLLDRTQRSLEAHEPLDLELAAKALLNERAERLVSSVDAALAAFDVDRAEASIGLFEAGANQRVAAVVAYSEAASAVTEREHRVELAAALVPIETLGEDLQTELPADLAEAAEAFAAGRDQEAIAAATATRELLVARDFEFTAQLDAQRRAAIEEGDLRSGRSLTRALLLSPSLGSADRALLTDAITAADSSERRLELALAAARGSLGQLVLAESPDLPDPLASSADRVRSRAEAAIASASVDLETGRFERGLEALNGVPQEVNGFAEAVTARSRLSAWIELPSLLGEAHYLASNEWALVASHLKSSLSASDTALASENAEHSRQGYDVAHAHLLELADDAIQSWLAAVWNTSRVADSLAATAAARKLEALAELTTLDDPQALEGRLRIAAGQCYWEAEAFAVAQAQYDRSKPVFQSLADPLWEAEAYSGGALCRSALAEGTSEWGRCILDMEQAAELFKEAGHVEYQRRCEWALGVWHRPDVRDGGSWDRAARHFGRSADLANLLGDNALYREARAEQGWCVRPDVNPAGSWDAAASALIEGHANDGPVLQLLAGQAQLPNETWSADWNAAKRLYLAAADAFATANKASALSTSLHNAAYCAIEGRSDHMTAQARSLFERAVEVARHAGLEESARASESWIPADSWSGTVTLKHTAGDTNGIGQPDDSSYPIRLEVQVSPSPLVRFSYKGRSYQVDHIGQTFEVPIYNDTRVTFRVEEFLLNREEFLLTLPYQGFAVHGSYEFPVHGQMVLAGAVGTRQMQVEIRDERNFNSDWWSRWKAIGTLNAAELGSLLSGPFNTSGSGATASSTGSVPREPTPAGTYRGNWDPSCTGAIGSVAPVSVRYDGQTAAVTLDYAFQGFFGDGTSGQMQFSPALVAGGQFTATESGSNGLAGGDWEVSVTGTLKGNTIDVSIDWYSELPMVVADGRASLR